MHVCKHAREFTADTPEYFFQKNYIPSPQSFRQKNCT